MNEPERLALIHMLEAQRQQITASLLLLTKDEPPAPAEGEPPRRRERPVFGSQRTGG
jgi:hypothetical protein